MRFHTILFFLILLIATITTAKTQELVLDVISYDLTLEPNLKEASIEGRIVVSFKTTAGHNSITLDAGNLQITQLTGENVKSYQKSNAQLIIELYENKDTEQSINISYQGEPRKGLLFNPDLEQAYTIYFTSQWMVCNAQPSDKAVFNLDILVPKGKQCLASGELVGTEEVGESIRYHWEQKYESPAYTYGFVIGNYQEVEEQFGDITVQYYGENYTVEELKKIFQETSSMISFFEEKSGIQYEQTTYSQILIGEYYQEMSGFATLKHNYGDLILQDSTEINLISHELAHQWWGNRITCKNWNHFWLNEAMATFMSAAYNEHRFGQEVYLANINSYYEVYQAVKSRGNDKSLVFDDWINPSRDDRNLVYFKGAYVLHLLKEKLGDDIFWNAIQFYTQQYYGMSVETIDFQKAMEIASGINLEEFFKEWVYHQ